MPEVPKIVYDRLRAGSPGGTVPQAPHPDPDVLTAFAEQTLSAAEREAVLQHLARCGDCRELAALSIPPIESSAQFVAEEKSESSVFAANRADGKAGGRRSWFVWPWSAWPWLRWAALAAGIAVAGSILLIHPGKPSAVREAKQQPANTVARTEENIVAKKTVPAPATEADNNKPAEAGQAFLRDKESKLAYPPVALPKAVTAEGQLKTQPAAKDSAVGAAVGGAVTAPASPSPAPPQIPTVSETVEVSAASAQVATEEARNDLAATTRQLSKLPVNERKAFDLAITKAKPAKPESNASSAQPQSEASLQRLESLDKQQVTTDTITQQRAGLATNGARGYRRSNADQGGLPQPTQYPAQWAIHGNELQRSLDAGVAWETVLRSDSPLLCYAAGSNDIWAGGKGGSVFHSANGGITWDQVHPSSQEQTLADDVTHIDIYSPSQLVLSTSTHQSWSTADGGKTWTKK